MFAEREENQDLNTEELLRLARNRSSAARAQLSEIVSDLFFKTNRVLSEQERAAMTDILRQLIHDVEISVRKHLAIRLSDEPEAPSELVNILANDVAEIAHPILTRSQVLQDPELIEIIRNRSLDVRRHINWNNLRSDLKEDLAHLVQDIKRRICGIAIAGSPSFSP